MADISPDARAHIPIPDAKTGRLLPTAIDDLAREHPTRIFAECMDSAEVPGAPHKFDYATLARAINRTAWWMKDMLSPLRLPKFSVVAYSGLPDIRYYFVLVAAIKCGITIQFPSRINDVTSTLRLMKSTNCAVRIQTSQLQSKELNQACELPCFELPELDFLIDPSPVEHFPYTQTYAEAARDPVVILQTSGSTGFPKPLVWTNAHIFILGLGRTWPVLHGRPVSEFYNPEQVGHRRFMGIVIYHASMVCGITSPVFTGVTAVFGPLHIPLAAYTAKNLEQWLTVAKCDSALLLPVLLNLSLESQYLRDVLRGLRKIFYIGAPLSPKVAQELCPHVHLATLWGITEASYVISQETDPEDHAYICIDEKAEGVYWHQLVPGENLYEMRYIRLQEHDKDYHELLHPQYVFLTLPDLSEFSTGDLFSKHPTKPGHWKHESRTDDHIILNIGVNVNPHAFEARVAAHPSVKSAILIGTNRSRVCLLLELEECHADSVFDDEIWPLILRASVGMRAAEQVARSMIVITSPDKPLPRSFKGAVKRKEACEAYSEEIEACYAKTSRS